MEQAQKTVRQPRTWVPPIDVSDIRAKRDSVMFRGWRPPRHPRQDDMDAYRAIPSLYR
jgi:hypothetical protein